MKKYKVLASLHEELNQGWVWVTSPKIKHRCIVKISNKRGASIYCECLQVDKNYLSIYNKPPRINIDPATPTITISHWYRNKLGGIETRTNQYLEIKIIKNNCHKLWGLIHLNLHHPQAVVKMATIIAIISLVLGVIGICF